MRLKITQVLLLVSLCTIGFGQTEITQCYLTDSNGLIRNHNADFLKLSLDVAFIPEEGKVTGKASYQFKPLQYLMDTLFLDGPGILVENVQLDGLNAKFKMDSAGITVYFNPPLDWNEQYELTINYETNPKRGIYFVGWNVPSTAAQNDPDRIRKQIWTQGQGVDNRFWIPSYDGVNDKLITELNITFDKNYTVISNGNLLGTDNNNNNTKTWHYQMQHPHTLYLIMLAIGEYAHQNYISKSGVVTSEYYYPDKQLNVEPTYRYSAEMMDWITQELQVPYPWDTYANVPVQEFLYGAMENTTATIYSDFFFQDERTWPDKNYVAINAHELTHQWFGDYVSAWSGSSHWLQESFATYYSKKFRQSVFGEDVYQWARYEEMQTAQSADANNNLPVGHSQAGSQRVYQKGSFVLDMMRYVAGEEQFRKVITEFLRAHPYQNVESRDLEMQFMKTLGMNMNWFFDEWIYRGGFPEYTITEQRERDQTRLTIIQTQKVTATTGLFKMPVHVQVHYTDGDFNDQLIWVEADTTIVNISNTLQKQVAFILFDPGQMILSKIIYNRPYADLRYQAFNAENMIDRYRAIYEMRETPIEIKRDDLIKLFNKESFHSIKSEIVYQLSGDEEKASIELMRAALQDKDPFVRRSVVNNAKSIAPKLEKDVVKLLSDPNYTNIELALVKLCELNPDKKSKYLDLTKNETGANKNIRIAWLEIACSVDQPKYIDELIKYTGPSYEFRTRVDAINSIQNLKFCNDTLLDHLFNAACSANNRLAGPARAALKKLMEQTVIQEQIKSYYASHNWDSYQQQRLKALFE